MAGRIPPNYNGLLQFAERTFSYNENHLFHNSNPFYKYTVTFYEGYDETSRRIGIKTIQPKGPSTDREIEILKTLDHPHIVRYMDAAMHGNGDIFIVMDLARGASLDNLHPNNFQKTSTIKTLAYQLFEALSYLHGKNIIHYDLRDRNIFWDPKTNALTLIDFDAAQM